MSFHEQPNTRSMCATAFFCEPVSDSVDFSSDGNWSGTGLFCPSGWHYRQQALHRDNIDSHRHWIELDEKGRTVILYYLKYGKSVIYLKKHLGV